MATILPFVVSPRTVASSHAGEAAIIIFPGVRYEPAEDSGRRGQAGSGGERKGR